MDGLVTHGVRGHARRESASGLVHITVRYSSPHVRQVSTLRHRTCVGRVMHDLAVGRPWLVF